MAWRPRSERSGRRTRSSSVARLRRALLGRFGRRRAFQPAFRPEQASRPGPAFSAGVRRRLAGARRFGLRAGAGRLRAGAGRGAGATTGGDRRRSRSRGRSLCRHRSRLEPGVTCGDGTGVARGCRRGIGRFGPGVRQAAAASAARSRAVLRLPMRSRSRRSAPAGRHRCTLQAIRSATRQAPPPPIPSSRTTAIATPAPPFFGGARSSGHATNGDLLTRRLRACARRRGEDFGACRRV